MESKEGKGAPAMLLSCRATICSEREERLSGHWNNLAQTDFSLGVFFRVSKRLTIQNWLNSIDVNLKLTLNYDSAHLDLLTVFLKLSNADEINWCARCESSVIVILKCVFLSLSFFYIAFLLDPIFSNWVNYHHIFFLLLTSLSNVLFKGAKDRSTWINDSIYNRWSKSGLIFYPSIFLIKVTFWKVNKSDKVRFPG